MQSEAERKLLLALAHSPTHTGAHLELAKLYWEAGKKEEAGRVYRKALELDPSLELPREHLQNQFNSS